eukprot:5667272-Prymnesium_polylepis.2
MERAGVRRMGTGRATVQERGVREGGGRWAAKGAAADGQRRVRPTRDREWKDTAAERGRESRKRVLCAGSGGSSRG